MEKKCPQCGGPLDKDGCCKKCGICVVGREDGRDKTVH